MVKLCSPSVSQHLESMFQVYRSKTPVVHCKIRACHLVIFEFGGARVRLTEPQLWPSQPRAHPEVVFSCLQPFMSPSSALAPSLQILTLHPNGTVTKGFEKHELHSARRRTYQRDCIASLSHMRGALASINARARGMQYNLIYIRSHVYIHARCLTAWASIMAHRLSGVARVAAVARRKEFTAAFGSR